MRTLLPAVFVALALSVPPLLGQTIAGRVVRGTSGTPAGRTAIALVDDSAIIVSSTQADTAGIFYADAPGAGRFRVVFFPATGGSFVSPPFQLDSGVYIEHEFTIPDIPAALRNVSFAGDVTHPAAPMRGNRPPVYPRSLATKGVRGLVNAMFVVDTEGKPETETLQLFSSSDSAFSDAVRQVIGGWHFTPADLDGKKVPQMVQETFDFGLPGDAPRGNVIIRTMAGPGSER
jgi:hypothetical protein